MHKTLKTIGFTVYFAFLTQKSDFQLGRTIKKVRNHYKTIGFIDKVVQKRPGNQFGPVQTAHWHWKPYIGPLQTRCLGNKEDTIRNHTIRYDTI